MRTNILPSELQVGQRVAIGRYGSWGNVSSQGVYVVAKVDKMKAVLRREGDGHERTWSVKRNEEFKKYSNGEKYVERNTFIETVESMEERNERRRRETVLVGLWKDLEKAAERKNVAEAEAVLAKIKEAA